MAHAARAELESLLRARKLDVTLTTSAPWAVSPGELAAPTGVAAIDARLGGGLRRGHVSEIVGPRSAGRTTVLCHSFAAATDRGELVALIDACDRFDPASAESMGIDLETLLWVRERGDIGRALKAMNLVLQAGGFGIVALDVADLPSRVVKQVPYTTWIRLARVIEGSQTVGLVVGSERIARSPGGVTIALESPCGRWSGESDRARLLHGVDVSARVIAGHSTQPCGPRS